MTYTSLDSHSNLTKYQINAIEEVLKIIDSEYFTFLDKTNIILVDYNSLRVYYNKLVSPVVNINNTLYKFAFVADDIISIAGGKAIYLSPDKFKYYNPKIIDKYPGLTDSIFTCRLLGILIMNIILLFKPGTSPEEALELTLDEFDKFSSLHDSTKTLDFFYGLTFMYIRNEFLEFINNEFLGIIDEELI